MKPATTLTVTILLFLSVASAQQPLLTVRAMRVPESVCYDAATGYAYVSNIVGGGWEDDRKAFITRLKPNGEVDLWRWRTKTTKAALSAPKGMCILAGSLYVADITKVHRFALTSEDSDTVVIKDAQKLNDMATDGKNVWVSDTGAGKVHCLSRDLRLLKTNTAVPSLNGITFAKGRMFAVSWDLHEVYELDPKGEVAPRAFGLAANFKDLDGIEVLDDGSFVVSDFYKDKVFHISADEKTVKLLLETKTPADIGLDRKGKRLFVPQFYGDRVVVIGLP